MGMLHFLNTAVLGALLGVGLPFLIHLLARQKLQRIEFSSTVFLKRMQKQKMRQVKLRQLLLLVLRCLAIFLLVVAFARPTFRVEKGAGSGQARSSLVLIVDRSMSMGSEKRFLEAQKKAESILNLVRSEDEAALVWTVPSENAKPAFTHDRAILNQAVEGQKVSWERAVVPKCVAEADALLARSHNIHREIYIVSDLQSTGFSVPADSSGILSWEGKLFILPISVELRNVALINGGVENQILQPGAPVGVFAEIKNFGKTIAENVLARLSINGDAVAQRVLTVEPGATQRVSFRVNPKARGWIGGAITINTDDRTQDNTWFFTFRMPSRYTILLVGKTTEDVRSMGLALNSLQEGGSVFLVNQAIYGDNWISNMEKADVLFFSNYPAFRLDEADRLKTFVESGKGVFFFMGSDVDLRQFDSFLSRLGHVSLGNIVGSGGEGGGHLSFGSFDLGHPLFKDVFEKGKENIRSPQFFRAVETIGGNPRTIVSFGNRMPFLVEMDAGKGKVLLATSGLQDDWSDLAFSTIFAPMVVRSASYLANPHFSERAGRTVGESISLAVDGGDKSNSYSVETPRGDRIRILPEIRDGKIYAQLGRTEIPGIYRFYSQDTLLGMEAVNIDPRESDVRFLSEEELRARFPKAQLKMVPSEEKVESVVSRARYGREVWREAILLAVLVLIVEMLLARERKSA